MKSLFTSARLRKATAATELAVILPFLLVILLGALDFGRFASVNISVTTAAGSGAAFGASHPVTPETESRWEAQIREAVVDEMQGIRDFEEAYLTVSIARVVELDGSWTVEVTVSYPFKTVIKWPWIAQTIHLVSMVKNQGLHP